MDDQFNTWVNKWEKALADGVFDNIEKEKSVDIQMPKNSKESFFGNLEINTEFNPNQGDVDYWNDINNYTESETVLNESTKEKKKEERNKKVEKIANLVNPTNIDTINKDTNKIKELASNKNLDKLAELKNKFYELENEILTKETLGKDYTQAEKSLKKIKKLIDQISSSISPEKFDSSTEE